jgi:predicted Zn-dependent protease
MKILSFMICLLALLSCGKSSSKKSSNENQDVSTIYSATEIKIQVYYEPGAEPYTDELPLLSLKLWDLFQVNMNSLFEGRNTKVSIPKSLEEMKKTKDFNKATWTTDEVLAMSQSYSTLEKGLVFQIFFVNGSASDNSEIIGFHISGTKTMVIFKDVIARSTNGDALVPKYVEQATLIHEMGHALGLVNNGLPMTTPHHDKNHSAHCSNENCVMYYANEGAGSLIKYVSKIKEEKTLIMFDQQCLSDSRSYKQQ